MNGVNIALIIKKEAISQEISVELKLKSVCIDGYATVIIVVFNGFNITPSAMANIIILSLFFINLISPLRWNIHTI